MISHSSLPAGWLIRARRPPDDPVNLIFLGADAAEIGRLLRRELHPAWHRMGWARGVADLALGRMWTCRRHIRIYDCLSLPPDPAWCHHSAWSVATAHLEHFDRRRRNHLIDSWNEPRDYLVQAISALGPDRIGQISTIDLGGAGSYYGRDFDGRVAVIAIR